MKRLTMLLVALMLCSPPSRAGLPVLDVTLDVEKQRTTKLRRVQGESFIIQVTMQQDDAAYDLTGYNSTNVLFTFTDQSARDNTNYWNKAGEIVTATSGLVQVTIDPTTSNRSGDFDCELYVWSGTTNALKRMYGKLFLAPTVTDPDSSVLTSSTNVDLTGYTFSAVPWVLPAEAIQTNEFTQDSSFLVGTGNGTFQEETGLVAIASMEVDTYVQGATNTIEVDLSADLVTATNVLDTDLSATLNANIITATNVLDTDLLAVILSATNTIEVDLSADIVTATNVVETDITAAYGTAIVTATNVLDTDLLAVILSATNTIEVDLSADIVTATNVLDTDITAAYGTAIVTATNVLDTDLTAAYGSAIVTATNELDTDLAADIVTATNVLDTDLSASIVTATNVLDTDILAVVFLKDGSVAATGDFDMAANSLTNALQVSVTNAFRTLVDIASASGQDLNWHVLSHDSRTNLFVGKIDAGDRIKEDILGIFMGADAGKESTNVETSVLIGTEAGAYAQYRSIDDCVYVGDESGYSPSLPTSGCAGETYVGYQAGWGFHRASNVGVGTRALARTIGGGNTLVNRYNTATGYEALGNLTTAVSADTAMGYMAGSGASGNSETAIGYQALKGATAADGSTAVGRDAGNESDDTDNASSLGYNAGGWADGGDNTVNLGLNAGISAQDSVDCFFGGSSAGNAAANATGVVAVGALSFNAGAGSYNSLVGYGAANGDTLNGGIVIGANADGAGDHNAVIGGNSSEGYVTNIYLGQGTNYSAPAIVRLITSGALASNVAGANMEVRVSAGTGTGVGGHFEVWTAEAGAASATNNSHAARLLVHDTGEVEITDHLKLAGIVAEPGNEAGYAKLWGQTNGAVATIEMWAADDAGNETLLTSHNFAHITNDPYFAQDTTPYSVHHKNKYIGIEGWIYLSKMAKFMETLCPGERFMWVETNATEKIDYAVVQKNRATAVAAEIAYWDAAQTAHDAWEAMPREAKFGLTTNTLVSPSGGTSVWHTSYVKIPEPPRPQGARPTAYVAKDHPLVPWVQARTNLVNSLVAP
jgi:hypothetical protein